MLDYPRRAMRCRGARAARPPRIALVTGARAARPPRIAPTAGARAARPPRIAPTAGARAAGARAAGPLHPITIARGADLVRSKQHRTAKRCPACTAGHRPAMVSKH
ncbi:hypothetical protein [Chloroflexus islandicus]|uniref:hypothetical protein n=1 Tax=Chloroflexus islandicus TaxID=1707952 RepID=UPI0012E6FBDE|nr:hypothetical protein [Chloroflexus islandicus]